MRSFDPVPERETVHDSALSSANTEVWLRWEYSSEEWALFEQVDWQPVQLKFWLLACASLLLLPIIGMLIWSSSSGVYPLLALSIVLFMAWIPILMLFAIFIDLYDEAKKRRRVRQQAKHAHSVTFDSQGLWEAGTYIPLNNLLFSLEKVRMTLDPPVIHFSRTRYTGKRTTPHSYPVHVLVPGGQEQKAVDLVQRFHTEVIQAREQSWQRMTNPPEPM